MRRTQVGMTRTLLGFVKFVFLHLPVYSAAHGTMATKRRRERFSVASRSLGRRPSAGEAPLLSRCPRLQIQSKVLSEAYIAHTKVIFFKFEYFIQRIFRAC